MPAGPAPRGMKEAGPTRAPPSSGSPRAYLPLMVGPAAVVEGDGEAGSRTTSPVRPARHTRVRPAGAGSPGDAPPAREPGCRIAVGARAWRGGPSAALHARLMVADGCRLACRGRRAGGCRLPRQGAPSLPARVGWSGACQTGALSRGAHWDRLGRPKTRRRSRRLSSRRRRTALQEAGADAALDRLKYEVAEELGLRDDVEKRGWAEMTTREVGTIGGHMVRRMVRFAERHMPEGGAGAGGRADT